MKKHVISVRLKTVLSLMLVAMIPICCLITYFYNYNVKELQKDIEQLNINRVSQIKNEFDNEIKSHLRLRQVICEHQMLLSLIRRGKQSDIYDALSIFKEYLSYRDSKSDASIMICSRNEVMHRTGMSSSNVFFKTILNIDAGQSANVLAAIANMPPQANTLALPLTKNNGERELLCVYQLPMFSRPEILLMVEMSQKEINGFFTPLMQNYAGSVFLLNDSGKLIFAQDKFTEMAAELENIEFNNGNAILTAVIDNQNYSVVYSRSETTGLTYGVAIANGVYHTQIIRQVSAVWQIILLAMMLCIAAILVLTSINYRPIKALVKLSGSGKTGDEYNTIFNSMISSQNRIEALTYSMEVQRPLVLERLLEYVLTSQLSPEQADKFFENMNLRFDHDCFFIISLRLFINDTQTAEFSTFKMCVIDAAEEVNTTTAHCYCIENIHDNKLSVVVNCDDDLMRREFVENFRDRIIARLIEKYDFIIGVGSVSHGYVNLKNSLYEANILVENILNRQISFSEEIETLPGNFRHLYPVKDMMLFQQQLRQGDEGTALITFEGLCAELSKYEVSNLIFRYVNSYIANSIAETARLISGKSFESQVERLMAVKSMGEFREASQLLIHDLCIFINDDKQRTSSRLRMDMMEYLDSNYTDPNMSLENIAEHFGLSPYYVSRFFRDQYNINIKDYVANLRIEKAMKLLTESDKQIGDIVLEIGYQSVSSFIRKFKSATGMTPGQYRESMVNAVYTSDEMEEHE